MNLINYCLCGCGKTTKKKYAPGHNLRIRNHMKNIPAELHPMHGKHHTAETKNKISANKKGKTCGENNPFYGKKHTEETLEKIKVASKNMWKSSEHRENFIFKNSGKNHWHWKGGRFIKKYPKEWTKELRETIKYRDNFKCQNSGCDNIVTTLNIHHIDYNIKNCHVENLITVCASCNVKANHKKNYWFNYYKIKIYNIYREN